MPSPALPAALLKKLGDRRRPAGLMAGPHAPPVVPVKVFIERDVILEVRIALEFFDISEYRTAARLVTQEQAG